MQVGIGPSNHTLTVRTINVGLTLLAVWDSGNMAVADYVPIPVEHTIHPYEAHRMVVGDVVCFAAQLASPDGERSACSLSNRHTVYCICVYNQKITILNRKDKGKTFGKVLKC